MQVTVDNKQYSITLRAWDGVQYSPDFAGDLFAWDVLQGNINADFLRQLQADVDTFNAGGAIEWMEHCKSVQEIYCEIKEVQD